MFDRINGRRIFIGTVLTINLKGDFVQLILRILVICNGMFSLAITLNNIVSWMITLTLFYSSHVQ